MWSEAFIKVVVALGLRTRSVELAVAVDLGKLPTFAGCNSLFALAWHFGYLPSPWRSVSSLILVLAYRSHVCSSEVDACQHVNSHMHLPYPSAASRPAAKISGMGSGIASTAQMPHLTLV